MRSLAWTKEELMDFDVLSQRVSEGSIDMSLIENRAIPSSGEAAVLVTTLSDGRRLWRTKTIDFDRLATVIRTCIADDLPKI
jgi:hypothetical protein